MRNIINIRPKSPCIQECEHRTATCKRDCELYKQYEAEYKEYFEKRQKILEANADFSEYKKKIISKQRKKHKKS